jgi:Bardet-Biedl syndrome 9 protein
MCKGSFGGVSNHEYICVQSMDGMLSIFEYESFSLSCFLPKVLLPGPIKYFKKTDSFITISSSWVLESYKYQVLAMSGKSNHENSSKAKRLLAEYSFNLGEPILDIDLVEQPTTTILVLGERNLFCLSENFTLRFMKKFDYNPSSFCVYPVLSSANVTNNNSVNFITATHSKVLFIHEDVRVKWAAQVDYVPVQIAVAKINDLQGVIVCLSEDGKLNCCYLGTEPALLNPISVREEKQFNFEWAETEYRSLQAKIKNSIMNTGAVLGNIANSGLVMSVDVPNKLDAITPMTRLKDTELKDPIDAIPSITCKLTLKSVETVQNVKVIIQCDLPIVAVPNTFVYSSIGSVPFEQEICFYAKTKHIPMSLNVTVCASYLYSINNVPKVSEARFRLPIKLVMKSGVQQTSTSSSQKPEDSKKSDQKKITIETNKPCVNLTELFPEFSGSYIAANGNIIAAQFYGHNHINVLVQAAKSGANRYRIQSDTYDSLWLVAQEFVSRLQSHFSKQSQDVTIIYKESLPMDDYRQLIDKHLELRQKTEGYKEMIEKYSVQFRAIQKRLLIKFKDKNPTSLDNMDALLEATYRQIVSLSDSYLNTYRELSLLSNSLNCMSRLFVLLMSLAFHLNKDSVQVLESIMSIQVNDTSELGWEEIVNAGMANLLRNALSKSSSKDASQQTVSQLKIPNDSTRLEKQFNSLVSKFESGASLLSNVYLNKGNY